MPSVRRNIYKETWPLLAGQEEMWILQIRLNICSVYCYSVLIKSVNFRRIFKHLNLSNILSHNLLPDKCMQTLCTVMKISTKSVKSSLWYVQVSCVQATMRWRHTHTQNSFAGKLVAEANLPDQLVDWSLGQVRRHMLQHFAAEHHVKRAAWIWDLVQRPLRTSPQTHLGQTVLPPTTTDGDPNKFLELIVPGFILSRFWSYSVPNVSILSIQ